MNNVEHFVHPGFFREIDKVRATLELAKSRFNWIRSIPGRKFARLVLRHALRQAEAEPHIDLACELNDNDPWTLLSSAIFRLLRIDRSGPARKRAVARAFTGAPISRMGHHGIIRFLCGDYAGAIEAIDRAKVMKRRCPLGGPKRCFISEGRTGARKRPTLRNGMRSFWVGHRADRRRHHTLGLAGPSDQRQSKMGSPARRLARRRAPGRWHRPDSMGQIVQEQRLIV